MRFKEVNIYGILGTVFFLVSILIIAITGIVLITTKVKVSTFEKTTATVSNVIRHKDSDGNTTYTTEVFYTVNGQHYHSVLNSGSSSTKKGSEVEIFYNPDNPSEIESSLYWIPLTLVMVLCGGIFLTVSLVFLGITFKRVKRKREAMQEGRPIEALITELNVVQNTRINNRHPYTITATYVDEVGDSHFYKSAQVLPYFKGGFYNEDAVGKKVTVYVSPYDDEIYYMDVKTIS